VYEAAGTQILKPRINILFSMLRRFVE